MISILARCSRAALIVAGVFGLSASPVAAREAVVLPSQPSVSPDGKKLVFAWRGDLWSASTAGGRIHRLTSHPGRDQLPKFSPDGSQIAFISDRGRGPQVYLMSAAGSEPIELTEHSAGYGLEGWFPDGKHLLATGARDHFWRKPDRLMKLRVAEKSDDRGPEEVLFDDYGTEASLSPDGKRLLFVREGVLWVRKGYVGSQEAQIWLYDLTTKQFTPVLKHPGGCRWPMWKPSGDGFYFVSEESGVMNLWEQDLKSGKRKQLTEFEDDGVIFPTISRDGSTIVFRRLFDLYRFRPGDGAKPEPIKLFADADEAQEPQKRVTLTKASQAAFTNDGLEIAFIAGGDVWVMDTELREPKQVTDTPEEERDIIWSPDGETLWFTSDRGGQCDIWKARRADTRRFWWRNDEFPVEQVTKDADVESDLQFATDGSRLALVRGNGDLWTMSPTGTDLRRLLRSPSAPDYAWSPDSKWIAYAVFDEDFNRDVWIRPADGSGTPYNVSRHPDNDGSPVWSPDGKVLAYTGIRSKDESDIFYVWLRKQDDEQGSRDRSVESALEKIQKVRRKPTATATGTATPAATASPAGPATPTGTSTGGTAPTPKPTATATPTATPAATTPTTPSAGGPAMVTVTTTTTTVTKLAPITIDFDGLHERLKRIPIADTTETALVWAPDSKRLAFVAEIKGQNGLYGVSFPSPSSPSLITADVGIAPRWLSEGNQIVWLSQGVPASVSTTAGKQMTYRFAARQTVDVARKYEAAFDLCWRIMRDEWYDDRLGNRNWDDVRRKYRAAAGASGDDLSFSTVVNMMLGELNGSHLGYTSASAVRMADPNSWPIVTSHLGVRFDPAYKGPGLKIKDVIARGPADQLRSRLVAGEIILAIDSTTVDPGMDLTRVLNGPAERDVKLRVKSTSGQERELTIRPTTYDAIPKLLYEQWVRANRKFVETASKGTLGYVHIAGMDEPSLQRFEEELYSAASGKQGLVIDVRENGGGFTTDHLLTMLTQPQHAVTVPRGGGPGYPQDRKIYATWNKPIVVLCNQNSFSNAEIFSHAIKTLGRGKLVGVPTAGGVVSTGSATIMDLGTLRLPTRGWFLPTTGEDMELNGAVPDVVVWPLPGQMPAGKDVQLEKAVEVLSADVKQWLARPQPKLRKATERADLKE